MPVLHQASVEEGKGTIGLLEVVRQGWLVSVTNWNSISILVRIFFKQSREDSDRGGVVCETSISFHI